MSTHLYGACAAKDQLFNCGQMKDVMRKNGIEAEKDNVT